MSVIQSRFRWRHARVLLVASIAILLTAAAFATTVAPVPDAALYQRSDVVVRGTVLSSGVIEDVDGSPLTITEVAPIEVFKGGLAGNLVLRQAGGELPDGRFFKLWGRPEFTPGTEVIVFAIARADGGFQTADMLLGKFEVARDEANALFAVAPLSSGEPEGVTVVHELRGRNRRSEGVRQFDSLDAPRAVEAFASWLRNGARGDQPLSPEPVGRLRPVVRDGLNRIGPQWVHLGNSLWRYNNNATAAWYLNGTANMTGGGTGEAQRALATWNNDPTSTINLTMGGSNPIHLNAMSSPCGWSTTLPASLGVIGCGGPRGAGSHSWRGDTYGTITGGEVWVRAFSTLNQISSAVMESVILHEVGHALGLGHSDDGSSPHDGCKGDEAAAIMRATVQSRTTLGTDDQDAIRWLYGDGGSSCSGAPPPACNAPSITLQPQSTSVTAGSSINLSVAASGATSYQWYAGAVGNTGSPVSGGTGASVLVTPSVTTSYWVRVTNSCGSVNSSGATVTVSVPCSLPSISSQPQPRSIIAGQSATISVSAAGASGYQWYIGNSGSTASPIAGATGASLTIAPSITTSYWVRVINSCGSVNSVAALVSVSPPACTFPSILSGPQPASIAAGKSATLSVTAAGATSFQWFVGSSGMTSSPVPGGTSASISVSPGSTTSYWVRVSNSCGSVNSAAATVTVTTSSRGGRKRPASTTSRPASGVLTPSP